MEWIYFDDNSQQNSGKILGKIGAGTSRQPNRSNERAAKMNEWKRREIKTSRPKSGKIGEGRKGKGKASMEITLEGIGE
jgi:hypothetical protein